MMIQKEGQRGSKTYPQSKDEVKNARENVVRMIYMDSTVKGIKRALEKKPEEAVEILSEIAAQVVMKVVTSIKGKFGSKVHIKLIKMLIKGAVSEMSKISEASGKGPIPGKTKTTIAKKAADSMDRVLSNKNGQPPPGGPGGGQPGQQMPGGGQPPPGGPGGGQPGQQMPGGGQPGQQMQAQAMGGQPPPAQPAPPGGQGLLQEDPAMRMRGA